MQCVAHKPRRKHDERERDHQWRETKHAHFVMHEDNREQGKRGEEERGGLCANCRSCDKRKSRRGARVERALRATAANDDEPTARKEQARRDVVVGQRANHDDPRHAEKEQRRCRASSGTKRVARKSCNDKRGDHRAECCPPLARIRRRKCVVTKHHQMRERRFNKRRKRGVHIAINWTNRALRRQPSARKHQVVTQCIKPAKFARPQPSWRTTRGNRKQCGERADRNRQQHVWSHRVCVTLKWTKTQNPHADDQSNQEHAPGNAALQCEQQSKRAQRRIKRKQERRAQSEGDGEFVESR